MEPGDKPLRRLSVDLTDIDTYAGEDQGAGLDEYEHHGYVDTLTGAVHIVYVDAFRCAEEEITPEELPNWVSLEDVEAAAAILRDDTGRYHNIERWESSEEFELMEGFAE